MRRFDRLYVRANRELVILLQKARVIFYWGISTRVVSGRPRRLQPIHAMGLGRVEFGENVSVGMFPSPGFLTTNAYFEARRGTARIRVGSGTLINNNFRAIAEHRCIEIGENCLIGANVEILDSDFHGIFVADRRKSLPEWARGVHISDNVFIGSNVVVLKGAQIGSGSVIANGSVVVGEIPANVIAGGNPARVLRSL